MARSIRLVATVAVAALGLAACGSGGGFDEEAYCKIALQLSESDGPPSAEFLDDYVAAAPDEIKDDAAFVAGKFKEADGNIGAAFSDPAVGDRIANIEAAETKRCDIDHGDGEGEGGEEEGAGDPEPAEGATVIDVTGVEYEFQGAPESAVAGPTAFGFTNGGEEIHEMVLFRLAEGATAEDVLALEGADDPKADEVVDEEVGGLFDDPGGESAGYLNIELTPGNYAFFCFVPGEGGEPHAALGMTAEFTVA